jgi:hypothetical protein
MTPARYAEILAEFDLVGNLAVAASQRLLGLRPAEPCLSYAEQIFVKLLAHCISLRRLSPDSARTGQEVWDLSSTATIARSVIEAYDALAYIALAAVPSDEREFRVLLWELHDVSRRAKMLDLIGSTDPRRKDIVRQAHQLTKNLVEHPRFSGLSNALQRKVRSGDPPQFANSQRERCQEADVNHGYYTAITMQLSQYAHTSPYAVHQLSRFRAGQPEARRLISLPIQYALVFLVRAVTGVQSLFPEARLPMSDALLKSIAVWTAVSRLGV